MKAFVAFAIVALLFVASESPSVDAAAELTQSIPSPGAEIEDAPDDLRLLFTQDIEDAEISINGSGLATELDGDEVSAPLSASDEGDYVVAWTVTSEVDGRETSGEFQFTVRSAEATEPLPEVDPEERAERVSEVSDDNRTEVLFWSVVGIAGAALLALVFFYSRTSIPTFGTTRIEGGLPPPGESPPEHIGGEDDDHR
jgi:methionine-rich copper-binding protein CopC